MTGQTARFPTRRFQILSITGDNFYHLKKNSRGLNRPFLDLKIVGVHPIYEDCPQMGRIGSAKERFAVAGVGAAGAVDGASFVLPILQVVTQSSACVGKFQTYLISPELQS